MPFFKYCLICLVLFLCCSFTLPADSEVVLSGSTARPLGLGNAYVGLSDDAAGLFINPAGLASLEGIDLTSMYTQPDENISFIFLAGALPLKNRGSLAVGYRTRTNTGVQLTSAETVDQTNQDIVLSYSRRLGRSLAVGLNFHYLSTGFSRNVAGFDSAFGNGYSFDLGFKYFARPALSLGLALEGLGGQIFYRDQHQEQLPIKATAGLALNFPNNLLFLFDVDKSTDNPRALIHAGLEWGVLEELFNLRVGLDQVDRVGGGYYDNLTLGFGLNIIGLTFDYSLYRNGDQSITNYFSIGYKPHKGQETKPIITSAPTVEARPLLPLKHFSDVPVTHWSSHEIEVLAALDIIPAYPDQTFRPADFVGRRALVLILRKNQADFSPELSGEINQRINRAETVKIIDEFEGLLPSRVIEAPYQDVGGRHWAARYITAAKEAGLLKFFGEKFEPEKPLTRAELANILYQTRLVQNLLKKYRFE